MESSGDIPVENPPGGDPEESPEQCPNHGDGEPPKRPIVVDPESVLAELEDQPTISEDSPVQGGVAPSEAQPPLHLFLRIYRANPSPLLSLTPYPAPPALLILKVF